MIKFLNTFTLFVNSVLTGCVTYGAHLAFSLLLRSFSLVAIMISTILFCASSAHAKEFFCSVDTVCSDKHPCYAIEYVWDMHIAQTDEGWVFTYDPDDGSRDVFHEIEGTENASKSLFLMRTQSDGENEQVTLFTILPDLKLAISTHYTEEFTDAETAFGSCEVME